MPDSQPSINSLFRTVPPLLSAFPLFLQPVSTSGLECFHGRAMSDGAAGEMGDAVRNLAPALL